MLKKILKEKLSWKSKHKLSNFRDKIKAFGKGGDLNELAKIYETDKYGSHYYTPHYMAHFKKLRYKRLNLLEIGVGGYEEAYEGGASLRMWKKYFPFGNIYSIDIYDKSALQENRITIFKGSQTDEDFIKKVVNKIGELDIIIDDGSHKNEHVIKTFEILFPLMKDGGIYVVEDTQTSYWKEYGGSSEELKSANTTMNYFKQFADSLNYQEFLIPDYEPTYFDKKIVSLHFYHNLIFIYKGDNDEKSNMVVNYKLQD
ncbi:MAG TPA: CmcI family methyltransferase [Balneolaceae bacterium]|nr:CmcI family methyltransferase [Balneolaceae bacterium]